MSRLNDLLRQLENTHPSLAKELRTEYDALADRKQFGLNFERHTPESVELPGRQVRRGDKVHVLAERGKNPTAENSRLWRVVAIDKTTGVATLEDSAVDSVDSVEKPVDGLVVVAEFRDPIYPGLVSTGRIERGGDKPFHTVINAENYHALQTLLFTHRGQVDLIYIDPPYNTGNEGWIYNDKYVAGDDHYKHSKWLAFMERRLLLAKELLKPTGVIIVAIGDEEHHRLRMLMDEIFDSQNFLANVVWEGVRKNDSRYVSSSADYMLFYARNEAAIQSEGIRWREPKPGVSDVISAGEDAWLHASAEGAERATEATKNLRSWWRSLPKDHPARTNPGLAIYDQVESLRGREGWVYRTLPLSSPNPRENLMYDVHHPNGKVCSTPPNGWRWSQDVMLARIAAGDVKFGATEKATVQYKRYLTGDDAQAISPVFSQDRAAASTRLGKILSDKRFPYPKDHSVIARWLQVTAPRDALVLDFFGGSGTTAEAIARLNAEDGGTRQCILVTNNEAAAADAKKLRKAGHRPGDPEWEAKGVYQYVTKPRISTVISGKREDGSVYSEGLDENVEFFDLTYEAPLRISTHREFAKIAPLLWMKAGSTGRRIDDVSTGFDVADTYAVLDDIDQTEAFLGALSARIAEGAEIGQVFVITNDDRLFTAVCRELPEGVEADRLYDSYLRNFEIESGRNA